MRRSREELFWRRVQVGPADQCWERRGSDRKEKEGRPYRRFGQLGTTYTAHRIAYELTHGPIPEGAIVRHTCNNHRCFNPRHLILGTHQDNMRDLATEGRSPSGEEWYRARARAVLQRKLIGLMAETLEVITDDRNPDEAERVRGALCGFQRLLDCGSLWPHPDDWRMDVDAQRRRRRA